MHYRQFTIPLSRILTLLLIIVFSQTLSAQTCYTSPKYEVRGVWLTTLNGLDWPRTAARNAASTETQKRELCQTLDQLQQAGINTVLLQTRVRATTIYPSALEPWDGCLTGTPGQAPDYDPLRFAIDECHRRGMELHAWIVAIPVGKWNSTGCKRLRQRLPNAVKRIGADGYMDPAADATANHLASLCAEIVSEYDVDGIHLDYIRYPEQWSRPKNAATARASVTDIVRRVSRAVRVRKPWVKVSCATIGKYSDLARQSSQGWNARDRVFQDAKLWMAEGLVDQLYPMIYFRGNQFYPFALDWMEHSGDCIVCPGLATYMLSPAERDWPIDEFERQAWMLRSFGLGHAHFRSRFLTRDIKGVNTFSRYVFDSQPALVPAKRSLSPVPGSPRDVAVWRGADADVLTWGEAVDHSDGPYILYNVYASRTWPVDVSNPANLIAIRRSERSLRVPLNGGLAAPMHYAVAAVDRYGREGEAVQTAAPKAPVASSMLPNDGRRLPIPQRGSVLDADYVAIETLQGTLVATCPYAPTVDIADLPEGVYVLRSLGRKGVTHRLGHFIVRRNAAS